MQIFRFFSKLFILELLGLFSIIFFPNFNFWPKFTFSDKGSIFDQNFDSLKKTLIFDQNFNYLPKVRFLNKFYIFVQNFDFNKKFDFSSISGQNLDFFQRLNFWRKYWFLCLKWYEDGGLKKSLSGSKFVEKTWPFKKILQKFKIFQSKKSKKSKNSVKS